MENNTPPAAGKGRPKGSANKTTTLAKEAIALAAEGLGGTERLINWAKEDPQNERVFWSQMFTKLMPLQGPGDNGEHLVRLSGALSWQPPQ